MDKGGKIALPWSRRDQRICLVSIWFEKLYDRIQHSQRYVETLISSDSAKKEKPQIG